MINLLNGKLKIGKRERRWVGVKACFLLCFLSYWSPGYGYGMVWVGVWYGLYLTGLGWYWKSLYFEHTLISSHFFYSVSFCFSFESTE